ncbi:hypothetical protein D9611_006246 [Ephemerocybe angulata]|uniref:Steroid 5-alpha reductase C-terminal domain-containing protein n=1 Tax=Ephemerocybe angulata TaxID=980116 RepID=A0A8H5FG46_9AGAR|nr:hypothetical protein D9611_006246 [Tulosesus angulatus]
MTNSVHVLDRYYLGLTLLVTLGYQLLGFAIAWTFQFDKITDFTGAILTLCIGNTFYARNIVASALVMVWACRIAGFLLFRVLKMGKDARFDDIRSSFWKFLGEWAVAGYIRPSTTVSSLTFLSSSPSLAFWIAQILWVWTVSLPVTILNSPSVSNPAFGTSRDIAGIVLWAVGFLIETIADAQKYRAKATGTVPKGYPMNKGLWAWSRHPPYFGEMLCWWGIWILCISPATNGSLSSGAKAALYGSVVSPLFTFLILMFGSGVPTGEKPVAERYFLMSNGPPSHLQPFPAQEGAWDRYKNYLNETSILIPIPPPLYRPLPTILKRTLLMDFPFYQFREEKEGKAAIGNATRDN